LSIYLDPPKAISDIVESVLGAVHTDGGFADGQAAVVHLMTPVLNVLLKARSENRDISLKHPKKMMQEMGGEILELSSSTESEFAVSSPGTDVLFGYKWDNVTTEGNKFIATVELLGSAILALADPSATVGRNKACALIVSTLQTYPDLRARVQLCRANVESDLSHAALSNRGEGVSGKGEAVHEEQYE
jgi:hypothetical protein